MQKFGLIGFPVKHSYSAIMHNAAFRELGIDAGYELFEISPGRLGSEFQRLLARGISGFNVTVPYKEAIIGCLGHLDQEAQLIGAVNTIKVEQGDRSTTGFNTDGLGFITHLTRVVGFDPKSRAVSILGAGGAAKAVAIQLARAGIEKISLFDIDQGKAQALAAKLRNNFSGCLVCLVDQPNALVNDKPDLLINATTLGMRSDDQLVFDSSYFHRQLIVYDLVYNPPQTALLQEAKRKGCLGVFNGLGMLLYQGVEAFKIWLDVEPPVQAMEQALSNALLKE